MTMTFAGGTEKNLASAATCGPEVFMNVRGLARFTARPPRRIVVASAPDFLCGLKVAPSLAANRSATMNPRLCRVLA
ncbi:Uncharacterised protein [Mycobacteroides abscessus subsp. abscessus]|nr:Uncharacterised protein [Mycobacteroides abscessus subsp. abscessus]